MTNKKVGLNNESNRKEWLKEIIANIPSGSQVLDAGAGELANKAFCAHLHYQSQDFSQYQGQGDGGALQTGVWDTSKIDIVSDICSIPAEGESFDAILCTEVLEHIPEPINAIAEFSRLLKANGELVITAPFCSLTHFSPYHFYSGFNRYFYTNVLEQMGFEIIEIRSNGNFFEYLAQEVRRLPSVSEQYRASKLNILEKLVVQAMIWLLSRLNKNQNGSDELLCYGYQVYARKKP